MEEISNETKKASKGKTLAESEIYPGWMNNYARITIRYQYDHEFSLKRYPNEQRPYKGDFTGGFFDNREWTLRKGLQKHESMCEVFEYE